MDQLLLFPAVKRIGKIRGWANTVSGYNPKSREKTLQIYLGRFADGLRRQGFADDVVNREIASLEVAVRVEIGRLLHYCPGRSA
jgi:hypothetical protein